VRRLPRPFHFNGIRRSRFPVFWFEIFFGITNRWLFVAKELVRMSDQQIGKKEMELIDLPWIMPQELMETNVTI
jgi:hypothetical protein